MLKKNELVEYFYKGIKDKKNLKIGVEHEKFVLSKNGFHPVSYEMQNGIKDILLKFVKMVGNQNMMMKKKQLLH